MSAEDLEDYKTSIETIIDYHYDELFKKLTDVDVAFNEELYDLVIEYKSTDGLTVKRSWKDREERLLEGGQNF